MQLQKFVLIALLVTPLSACLDNDVKRAAAGAVAGAVVADVTNGDVVTGAAVGAAGGALCDDVNLCSPSR
ncbi:MAG: hypothetical protein CSA68_04975 [Rhodobacterales bacterium]|nr:MAG: hypothetical protein CSA68_04975 [Rhodobacterales bacterium]